MAMSKLQTISEEQWEEQVLRCAAPVLVDFRAPWCHALVLQDRLLELISEDYGEKIKVVLVDIVRSVDLALSYRVQDVPALTLFVQGRMVYSYSGPKRIEKMLDRQLSPVIS